MKKIIDEHGRVFGKVSVIDFLVILIVLVLGAALYVKYNVLEVTSVASKMDSFTYTVTIYGARDYSVNAFKPGDVLYDKNGSGGNTIGTISDVKSSEAKKASELVDGTLVMGNVEGRYDITLTVQASGSVSGGRYLVNKTYEVNANSQRSFYTKYCSFDGTITEIS
jgi:hypothetical protein